MFVVNNKVGVVSVRVRIYSRGFSAVLGETRMKSLAMTSKPWKIITGVKRSSSIPRRNILLPCADPLAPWCEEYVAKMYRILRRRYMLSVTDFRLFCGGENTCGVKLHSLELNKHLHVIHYHQSASKTGKRHRNRTSRWRFLDLVFPQPTQKLLTVCVQTLPRA